MVALAAARPAIRPAQRASRPSGSRSCCPGARTGRRACPPRASASRAGRRPLRCGSMQNRAWPRAPWR
eukprot:265307-Lingulodinium_polyedra.AAC.1